MTIQRKEQIFECFANGYLTISFEEYPEMNIGGVLVANLQALKDCK
jgi:hypothetical protein